MKKVLAVFLALVLVLGFAACGKPKEAEADKDYVIRIYSNSNSTERVTWFVDYAKQAGFNISIDDNSVISGDTAAVQAANEKKDGDILFGLNETRWGQVINGTYENLKLVEWTPSWADKVGDFKYDGKAYGLEKGWKCPVGIAYTLIARPAVSTGSELDFAIDFDKLGYKLEEGIYRLYTSPAKTHDVEIIGGNGETKEEREYINVYLEFEIKR